jgi:hypothetical protein
LNNQGSEKRKKTRVRFTTRAILKSSRVEIVADADTRDISLEGIYVKAEQKIPVGDQCAIEILLTGSSSILSIKLEGRVVRHELAGMGISFEGIELDAYHHLKNILILNSEDSSAIEKEMDIH